ncbi:hypothetical protein LPJ53_004132 [Coemansia erecta]|uniref:Chitin synthase n=1 Tax=Coemansia erecta TaxID=147472 RepID=A0A9W8CR89_9FUNG|nr:hypothetical protein LPJ53_004132 [Coemansia erecta]
MDKKRVVLNTPTGNRAGEYEMLDRNMTGANYSSGTQQPYGAHPSGGNVSRSDLDVLENTGPVHNNSYQHDMYGGGAPAAGGQYAGDTSSGYYGGDAGGHYVDNAGGQYQNDAGVGYFQHGDEYGAGAYDNGYQQAYKPLPTPNMLAGAPTNQSFGGLHEARSVTSTPVMTDDGYGSVKRENAATPTAKFDPRIMPQADPVIASLYDDQQAPPPNARKYKHFQSQRRHKLKEIELTAGHLIIDRPVPNALLAKCRFKDAKEFTHMRYSAVTCDPNVFKADGYNLRPALMGRQTELFIVLTMYNEDDILFNRTFAAVMKNIAHLCSRTNSRVWGPNAWEKVVVCIVADGRSKVHPRVLSVLGLIGAYQPDVMSNTLRGEEVTAHLFEYTTQVALDANMNQLGPQQNMPPVQVLFCLKEKNAKKINSHRWFFNAFATVLNPRVCVLIDVGTKPTSTSIYHLWKSFDHDERVAGACGEIAADLGKGCKYVFTNPLVAAQNFEYKISNILDKPLESIFGYISVLPGAFSAYRYSALQDTSDGVGPLSAYFKGELMHSADSDSGIFEANMYLAEDRILCFELVAKRKCNYVLRYVKSAKAVTDVPDNLSELISQRRRWLNGSFFAAFYAIVHWWRMFSTSHSLYRRVMLTIEFLYQTISMIFSWFAIANFYLAYYFLEQNVKTIHDSHKSTSTIEPISLNADPFHGAGYYVLEVFRELYILALIMQFVLSLGNRPQGTKAIYRLSVALFTIIMVLITYVALYGVVYTAVHTNYDGGVKNLLDQEKFRDIVISMAATYGVYFFSSFLYFEPWHMFTSFIQYTLWQPSSINILMVYAFCNTHDVSWGTKGDTGIATDLGHAKVSKKDGVEVAYVSLAADDADIDADYEGWVANLSKPEDKTPQKRDAQTKREDQNKIFRTSLVLAWMSTNTVLAMVISSEWFADVTTKVDSTGSHNPYLSFIFWSVAGLSAFRFLGSTWYWIRFVGFGCCR